MAPFTTTLARAACFRRMAAVGVFMVAASAASADDPKPLRDKTRRPCLAVLDFFVSGKVDAAGSRAAAALVRKEVNTAGKYDLIDRQMMVERMGEKDFAATSECDQLKCFVQYGKSLAADKIVGGSMVSFGESWLIEMRMVDVNTGREEKTFAKRHEGSMDDLLDLVVEGSDTLFDTKRSGYAINPRLREKSLTVDLGGGVGLELVLVPAGEFLMGSPEGEVGRSYEEGPLHQVRIIRSYYISKYEVTNAQFRRFRPGHDSGKNFDSEHDLNGDNQPVANVSWLDAKAFCAWLQSMCGRDARLPSEAEWEYACRAGTTTPFSLGSSLSAELANFDGDYPYGNGNKGVRRMKSMPVGSFSPNEWGLYDMHGNVAEWCEDYKHESYEGAPSNGVAWTTKGKSEGRISRGGGWCFNAAWCRSASRDTGVPGTRIGTIGIRVVIE